MRELNKPDGAYESIRFAEVGDFMAERRNRKLDLSVISSQSHLASLAERTDETCVSDEQLETATSYRMYAAQRNNKIVCKINRVMITIIIIKCIYINERHSSK